MRERQVSGIACVKKRPQAVIARSGKRTLVGLLDHFIRPHENRVGNLDAERFRGFHVDDQFELWSAALPGRSAGFAPLSILSTYLAALRNDSA